MITENQQAVLNQNPDFSVTSKDGVHEVTDRKVRDHFANTDASRGRYVGNTLDSALQQALEGRELFEAEMNTGNGSATASETKGEGNADAGVQEAPEAAKPEKPVATAPKAKAAGTARQSGGKAATATGSKPAGKPAATGSKPANASRSRVVPQDNDVDDVELDNTGKRERNRTVASRGSRGPRRYYRAALHIVDKPEITPEELSKLDRRSGEMSVATANHCLEAWHDITRILADNGHLTAAYKNRLFPKAPAKKAAGKK